MQRLIRLLPGRSGHELVLRGYHWRQRQHVLSNFISEAGKRPSPPLFLAPPLSIRPLCSPPRQDKPLSSPTISPSPSVPPASSPFKDAGAQDLPSNWNIANYITGFRLVLAPGVGLLILGDHNSFALVALSMAGISDALDGYLARRYALQTALGARLDPAADKLLIGCAAGALCVQGALPGWIVALVIARDTALVAAASCIPQKRWLAPIPVSKANTALQISLCVAGIASAGDLAVVHPLVVHGLAVATAATTSASGLMYAVRFWRSVK